MIHQSRVTNVVAKSEDQQKVQLITIEGQDGGGLIIKKSHC